MEYEHKEAKTNDAKQWVKKGFLSELSQRSLIVTRFDKITESCCSKENESVETKHITEITPEAFMYCIGVLLKFWPAEKVSVLLNLAAS